MKKIFLVFLAIFWSSVSTYHYNKFPYRSDWKEAPRYPDWCCPLEWTNMTQGEELPKDWIHAGTFMNRDFAFARNNNPHLLYTTVKSENIRDEPYAFQWYKKDDPFPILTNPNHCHIDWYTTKYYQDIPRENDTIFYPNTGHTPYGSYSQYQGMPGWMMDNGDFSNMKSLSELDRKSFSGVKQLYVDCLQSVTKMSTAKLVKLTFNQEAG